MKLSLLIVLVAIFVVIAGFQNPALFFVGYLWASFLYPSAFASTFVSLPLVFGVLSLVGYFFIDKSNRASFPLTFYCAIAFAGWVTFTTCFAVLPDVAWAKWNWAIESILIAIATPLFLRTRVQIDAGYLCVLAAMSAHVMTAGIKTLFGTGGYDRLGRLMMTNFWLGETSTLAVAAIITLPMAFYAARHSVIFLHLRGRLLDIAFSLYAFLAAMCVIGTSARTGVITGGAYLLFGIKGFFRKALAVAAVAAIYFAGPLYLPQTTAQRYNTIGTYQQDESAEIRLGVWRWALGYATSHPFGGGFGIFGTNAFTYQITDSDGQIVTKISKETAAHSIFFEVLAEQGFPGLGLYLALLLSALVGIMRSPPSLTADPELSWSKPFARSLSVCIVLYAVGGSFVGIAYQPLCYAFLGLYCSWWRLTRAQIKRTSNATIAADPAGTSFAR